MSRRIVLNPWVNGLGDNLAISTLPERMVREWDAEVYIKRNVRNDQISQLLWETNPFVSGLTDENPNIVTPSDEEQRKGCVMHGNIVSAIEHAMGFPPPYNKHPRIYYQPRFIRDLKDKCLLDPASVTCKIPKEPFYNYVDYLIKRDIIRMSDCLFLNCGIVDHVNDYLPEVQRLTPGNIFDVVDAIFSCRQFVTVQSGLCGISWAIKQDNAFPKVNALIDSRIFNNKVWVYPNINYYTFSQKDNDFEFI